MDVRIALSSDNAATVIEVNHNPEYKKEDDIGCPLTYEFFTFFIN